MRTSSLKKKTSSGRMFKSNSKKPIIQNSKSKLDSLIDVKKTNVLPLPTKSTVNIVKSNVNDSETRLVQLNVPEKVQKQLDEIIKNLQKNDSNDDEWEYFYQPIEWPNLNNNNNDDYEYQWIDEKDLHKYNPEQIIRVDYDPKSNCSLNFKSNF
ncbi:hypothetical protein BLA29_008049 [Euroglyphus maynei]|uniref:Uncharacterized protein n=1 Tax=Euroglyphus maynei TaxID=6958 RepID=A0A1Y3AQT8_EURMA|nr:hypothetical protein BLA29_008049 [Euroglyphus maynei]